MNQSEMQWQLDEKTAAAASNFNIACLSVKAKQYPGQRFDPEKRKDQVLDPQWPNDKPLCSSPDHIIALFQRDRHLEGLAMVVAWGGMGRRPAAIYKKCTLEEIHQSLRKCCELIKGTHSIQEAWVTLTDTHSGLAWSNVLASKCLHFMARACGFDRNPPVPIDNRIILERLWPTFRDSIKQKSERPDKWDKEFAAYSRYMTAIITWANKKGWTTTEVESTIFDRFSRLQCNSCPIT
jgi:hypothetical protein